METTQKGPAVAHEGPGIDLFPFQSTPSRNLNLMASNAFSLRLRIVKCGRRPIGTNPSTQVLSRLRPRKGADTHVRPLLCVKKALSRQLLYDLCSGQSSYRESLLDDSEHDTTRCGPDNNEPRHCFSVLRRHCLRIFDVIPDKSCFQASIRFNLPTWIEKPGPHRLTIQPGTHQISSV